MNSQKQVKITGLIFHQDLGIIQAQKLEFNENDQLTIIKGEVGAGKTHLQTALRLGTQGKKVLTDNALYGDIDLEVQLLDGTFPLWVGCKNKGKTLQFVLYTKDINGKKVKNPIIDGIEATPSKYLEHLQTELTWKMDELTSENPNIQKKILLKLYQDQFSKIGVIFDKNHIDYENSIKGQIDKAEKNRNDKDYYRKTKGGIADDLRAKGYDPDRPETCPNEISIEDIDNEIKKLEKEITIKESAPEIRKEKELAEIKSKASEVTNECLVYNKELEDDYELKNKIHAKYQDEITEITNNLNELEIILNNLGLNVHYNPLKEDIEYPKEVKKPPLPTYILFDKNNNVSNENFKELNKDAQDLVKKIDMHRQSYSTKSKENFEVDVSDLKAKIEAQEILKLQAIEDNKIVDAIDSFHKWRTSNKDVVRLKGEYIQLLAKVDTGVKGLEIMPIEDDIFLMYNGEYDPTYFNNINVSTKPISHKLKEYIKYEHIAKYIKETSSKHYFAIDKKLNIIKSDKNINNSDCLIIFRNHDVLSENDIIKELQDKKIYFYKEMRKLSSYSGTQRPVICLLIQNYLLSKKAKAMRYIYIDDIPHDNKTRSLLEKMSKELDLHIFLNWTGDFEQSKLNDGEFLIKGGEIFF